MTAVVLIRQLLIGISSGMVTFLGASGVSLIVSGMNLLNFAQGAFLMLGAYLCFTVASIWGFWWALLFAPLGVAIIGGITELLMHSLYKKNMLYQLIFTMGIAFILMDAMKLIWGNVLKTVIAPTVFSTTISFLGGVFPTYYLLIIVIAGLFGIALWITFEKTKLGMTFRAIISNREMVESLGINVSRLYNVMFVIGVWMSGVAGVLMAPIMGIVAQKSMDILFSIMTVIIIGGMTSMKGALFAALIVGVCYAMGSIFLPEYYAFLPAVLMIFILLVKPKGLFVSTAN